ncbi:hypothetical protein EMIHUDRAFT_125043, partial [Emiliania huxleyi CCMP1516]|uniref:Cyclic nucleotide-binding domain-containing protein n=2 Tax=Emiliania huxleyi TaxID=2903 RepID=A0A0D3I984_EMIH1
TELTIKSFSNTDCTGTELASQEGVFIPYSIGTGAVGCDESSLAPVWHDASNPSNPSPYDSCQLGIQYTCVRVENPCFDRATAHACRILVPDATAPAAYEDCFGAGSGGAAEKVLMAELRSGDRVLSSMAEIARVIVNQHKEVVLSARMVRISHSGGSLALTPDHVLRVDGVLAAARDVKPGSNLDGAKVESATLTTGAIINPVTTSGYILAAGPKGTPVVASSHPEWIAPFMLSATGLLVSERSLCSSLARLFPESAQAFYDAHLEAFLAGRQASLNTIARAPSPVLLAAVVALDLGIAAAFLLHSFGLTRLICMMGAGELAMLTATRRIAGARALDNCILYVLTEEAFEEVMRYYPNHYDTILEQSLAALEATLRSNEATLETRMIKA